MFFRKNNGDKVLSNRIFIKFFWYRLFYKDEYQRKNYDQKQVDKNTICPVAFDDKEKTLNFFLSWSGRVKTEVDVLSKVLQLSGVANEADKLPSDVSIQARSSEIGLIIRRLKSSDYAPFFINLRPPTTKLKNTSLEESLQQAIDDLEASLDRARLLFSAQSRLGLEIARASLNYFTVNKYSKKYGDKDPKDLIREKEKRK